MLLNLKYCLFLVSLIKKLISHESWTNYTFSVYWTAAKSKNSDFVTVQYDEEDKGKFPCDLILKKALLPGWIKSMQDNIKPYD